MTWTDHDGNRLGPLSTNPGKKATQPKQTKEKREHEQDRVARVRRLKARRRPE